MGPDPHFENQGYMKHYVQAAIYYKTVINNTNTLKHEAYVAQLCKQKKQKRMNDNC